MKARYADLTDGEAVELMRKKVAQVKALLADIGRYLREAGGE